ncbi:MAG: hypothetical protein KGQ59_10030 [Bdellovibrionales bacterium]|nr:hypothetical protein [Bdellovibrionales bacterium]
MALNRGWAREVSHALAAVSAVMALAGCPAATTSSVTRSDSTNYLSSSAGSSPTSVFDGGQLPDFGGATEQYLDPPNSCEDSGERVSTEVSRGLNIAAFERRIHSLPSQGAGFCARGVRKSLNALFGTGPGFGPPAKKYNEQFLRNWRTKDHCYKTVSRTENTPHRDRDFDIKVLQPGPGSSIFGHIEIYYKGRWYSDFQQGRSLYGRNYGSFTTYRLDRCNSSASLDLKPSGQKSFWVQLFHRALDWMVSDAWATEATELTTVPSKDIRSVSVGSGKSTWRLVDRSQNQGIIYILQSGVGRARKDVASDTNSAFDLLEKNRKKLGDAAQKLADAYVRDWITTEGRLAVQRVVTGIKEMTPLEREAYRKNGLKVGP